MSSAPQTGIVLVLSGPSGSGKTSLARRLVETTEGVRFSVSATTRPPREDETDGVDYVFLSKEQFNAGVEAGDFLEHAEVFGECYGTPRKPVDEALAEGIDVVLDIDVQGGTEVKEKVSGAVLVFILPPSQEALAERLRKRGTESDETLKHRLDEVQAELGYAVLYPYLVINGEFDEALERIGSIRLAEKSRYNRRRKDLPWKI